MITFTEYSPILYPYVVGQTLCYEVNENGRVRSVTRYLPEEGLECFGVDYDEENGEYYVTVDRL